MSFKISAFHSKAKSGMSSKFKQDDEKEIQSLLPSFLQEPDLLVAPKKAPRKGAGIRISSTSNPDFY